MNKLLLRFKRGLAIQKVLEKQDKQLLKEYLNRMRKKENKWMELAIQKFATRASIRSSPAISLWRLKAYVMNTWLIQCFIEFTLLLINYATILYIKINIILRVNNQLWWFWLFLVFNKLRPKKNNINYYC